MQTTVVSKSQYNDFLRSYLDFDNLKPIESIKTYESCTTESYHLLLDTLSRSKEGIDIKKAVKTFVDKAIEFIGIVINAIIQLIYKAITFFKKLILNTMDESLLKSYSQFYESHKESILSSYYKYASDCYVTAIPPKSINSFNADNKIVFSIQQTINVLEEIDRSFKQRVELWDERNKRRDNWKDSSDFFNQLRIRADTVKTHITDSLLLADIGIRSTYGIDSMALNDPQVKGYLISLVNKYVNKSLTPLDSFTIIFSIPKKVINMYLYGKEDVKPDVISIANFLQTTGPKEFDKLSYNDMGRIKGNVLITEGLMKRMEAIAKRLQVSGTKFCNSLKQNHSILVDIYTGGENESNDSISIAQKMILPLLSISNSIYSYFSTILLNYGIYYYHHRKALFDASKTLLQKDRLMTMAS